VFDLWNTLVPFPEAAKRQAFTQTVAALGVPEAALAGRWAQTRVLRETRPLAEYLRWLREDLAADWPPAAIDLARHARRRLHGACFTAAAVRNHAEVLGRLRAAGLRTAVVSNCSSDVRDMIAGSVLAPLLDTVVLSAQAGVMKPDPAIYARAAAELRLPPGECLYLGDGGDDELAGAAAAGMAPVLLDLGEGRRWAGRRVRDLPAVLTLLGLDHATPIPPDAEDVEAR
jgi:putative hydrolase of the HAD superfamily